MRNKHMGSDLNELVTREDSYQNTALVQPVLTNLQEAIFWVHLVNVLIDHFRPLSLKFEHFVDLM